MEIVQAGKEDIAELSKFAHGVFSAYYSVLIDPGQATYMADLFLSPEAVGKLMEEGAVFKMAKEGDEIIGFTEYKKEDDGRLFLSKLYADERYRGKGVGSFLFEDIRNYAKAQDLHKIYLTVNKGNTPSYEIYLHLGFKGIDAVVNDIGHGYVMDDYIMEYEVI